ncbi:hypothetical protein VTL71DRAFT_8697 [Oculimacula yallundae]|uniref:Uncharacterized protein n=1 Tax=Oculimacula yallundae TaxID=86028 RepID=A0ABR4CYH4_9HELO
MVTRSRKSSRVTSTLIVKQTMDILIAYPGIGEIQGPALHWRSSRRSSSKAIARQSYNIAFYGGYQHKGQQAYLLWKDKTIMMSCCIARRYFREKMYQHNE